MTLSDDLVASLKPSRSSSVAIFDFVLSPPHFFVMVN